MGTNTTGEHYIETIDFEDRSFGFLYTVVNTTLFTNLRGVHHSSLDSKEVVVLWV